MQDVVAAVVAGGALHGEHIQGFLHHTNEGGVALRVGTHLALAAPAESEVEANGTLTDGTFEVLQCASQVLGELIRRTEEVKGEARGGLGTDAGQALERQYQALQGVGQERHA